MWWLALFPLLVLSSFAPKGIVTPSTPKLIGSWGKSALFELEAEGYDDPILLVNLHGQSRYEIGYAYGILLNQQVMFNYWALIHSVFGNDSAVIQGVQLWLDDQYKNWWSQQLPDDYKEEFRGMKDAGIAVGVPELGRYLIQGFTISCIFTGDVEWDIEYLLAFERNYTIPEIKKSLSPEEEERVVAAIIQAWKKARPNENGQCSMWGAWGSRTSDGNIWTGRNLDWLANTGIAKYKLISVFHAPNTYAHATIGFVGLVGAITGISSQGLTVHEAGDDNKYQSPLGFGFSLRLRYIMENAATLEEAQTLWNATNNTMGLNHGIGSANDNEFMVMETMAGYTTYFFSDDPREQNRTVNGINYGAPLPLALWRTNHAYDPYFLETAREPIPREDSENRYMLIHDTLLYYQDSNTPISALQAVNITAVVGYKGGETTESFLDCSNATSGDNVISVSYFLKDLSIYVAWENGLQDAHVPACCNYYVKLNLREWLDS